MGNGAMIALASDNDIVVSDEIRAEYETLSNLNLSDAELQSKIIEKFKLSFKSDKVPEVEEKKIVTSVPSSKGGIKAIPKAKKRVANRRKSFDVETTKKDVKVTDQIVESASEPVLPTVEVDKPVEHDVDRWDSVSQQPFCKICNMAFKSNAFLDRHVKYSDIHQKAVKKIEAPELVAVVEKQVEGVHYKLMYSGNKLFWRSKENIDIFFYLHMLSNVIEVVMYNGDTGVELPRLYFSNALSLNLIRNSELESKISKLFNDAQQSEIDLPTDHVKVTESEIKDDEERKELITYFISRFQQTEEKNVIFILNNDTATNPTLNDKPEAVIPVFVARRRKSSVEEINKGIKTLENDLEELNNFVTSKLEHEVEELSPIVINYM
jgi:hypothetical protein